MNLHSVLILLLGATITVALAPRTRQPTEVLLLIGSLLLSFIPGLPPVHMAPQTVFFLFLPPILFSAAYFTSWRDFKANARPISLLAIGLVLFTTTAVAGVAKHWIPQMTWPIAFLLGAMVSPPDASAAVAIIRQLGVPRRLQTIIEGESLVNDATALVAYRFAVTAAITGSFSLWHASWQFIWVGAGGILVGLAVGWAGIWLSQRLSTSTPQILLSFISAFSAYTIGENLGVSGVIATVTAGLYFGRWVPSHASAQLRVDAESSWSVLLFAINGLVFTLMGLELREVLRNLPGYSWDSLIAFGAGISLVVIAVRFLWIFPATYVPRWLSSSLRKRDPYPSWKTVTILSWTAMRGIVSLASALAIPRLLPSGALFPQRNLLIFLTYSVILTTLLLPAFSLPWLLRRFGLKAGDENHREETKARMAAIEEVLKSFPQIQSNPQFRATHVTMLQERYNRRREALQSNLSEQAFTPLIDEDQQLRRLLNELFRLERRALIRLREDGQIHDDVFHMISRELDLEDLRLKSQRL